MKHEIGRNCLRLILYKVNICSLQSKAFKFWRFLVLKTFNSHSVERAEIPNYQTWTRATTSCRDSNASSSQGGMSYNFLIVEYLPIVSVFFKKKKKETMKERISHDESNSSPSSLIYRKQTQFSTTICRP